MATINFKTSKPSTTKKLQRTAPGCRRCGCHNCECNSEELDAGGPA
jgi:hypothetical protein